MFSSAFTGFSVLVWLSPLLGYSYHRTSFDTSIVSTAQSVVNTYYLHLVSTVVDHIHLAQVSADSFAKSLRLRDYRDPSGRTVRNVRIKGDHKMVNWLFRSLLSVALFAIIVAVAVYVAVPTAPTWERVDSFGGYSLLRYEGGAIAEDKSYNADDVLVGHRYTDTWHKTHIVTYDAATGGEIEHTVIE